MKTFWLRSSQLSSERSLICGWIEPERLFLNVESFCIRRRLPIFLGNFFVSGYVCGFQKQVDGRLEKLHKEVEFYDRKHEKRVSVVCP
jgi:hypothetical protein